MFGKRPKGKDIVLPDHTEIQAQEEGASTMPLLQAEPGRTYVVSEIVTGDEEMNSFLFRLGCYVGEPITLISKKKSGCVVVIKDGRYNFDELLSRAVMV